MGIMDDQRKVPKLGFNTGERNAEASGLLGVKQRASFTYISSDFERILGADLSEGQRAV